MVKVAKEYIGIVRDDSLSIHIIRLAEKTEMPYAVGFNLNYTDQNIADWDNSVYCRSLNEAWEILDAKCAEYDFKLSA